jgi:hypothetical protein
MRFFNINTKEIFYPLWLITAAANLVLPAVLAQGRLDPRYFHHGSQKNEIDGGTCAEFLQINRMDTCCNMRDDDCYMIHYDTRCYCDVFCDREVMNDNSDCCPDAAQMCSEDSAPANKTQVVKKKDCYKDGVFYKDSEKFNLNCNQCECSDGLLKCTENSCLINTHMLEEINRSRLPWSAGNYSFLWGKTLDFGYRNKLGTRLPRDNQRPLDVEESLDVEEYDFREVNEAAKNRKIQDQGNCGASWAFSTLGDLMEFF